MELFEARDHFIIQNGEHSLWCNRFDGALSAQPGSDILNAWNPVCLGRIHGVIGKMKIHPDSEWKLLLIRQQSLVGTLPTGFDVYKIDKVTILPLCLDEPKDLDIDLCKKHHFGISKSNQLKKSSDTHQKSLQKTWNSIKSAAENVKPKKLPFKIPALGEVVAPPQQQREIKEREKLERRVLEELNKMFNDSDSFYYCPDGDLTNSVQRQHVAAGGGSPAPPSEEDNEGSSDGPAKKAAWMQADDRFFWNKYMLQDLINAENPLADPWIVPIIQGYVQMEVCHLDFDSDFGSSTSLKDRPNEASPTLGDIAFNIVIISRRSRFRAGMRYKRRGVDEDGHCANYVETEQILEFSQHVVSFVQVRGSVPLHWSQTGIKYKPPPRIEKGGSSFRSLPTGSCMGLHD